MNIDIERGICIIIVRHIMKYTENHLNHFHSNSNHIQNKEDGMVCLCLGPGSDYLQRQNTLMIFVITKSSFVYRQYSSGFKYDQCTRLNPDVLIYTCFYPEMDNHHMFCPSLELLNFALQDWNIRCSIMRIILSRRHSNKLNKYNRQWGVYHNLGL